MKKNILLYGLALALVCLSAACADVEGLSDENSIDGFTVLSHEPETVELGVPEFIGDTIRIPILYGAERVPDSSLVMNARVEIDHEIDRISGLDFSKPVDMGTFQQIKQAYDDPDARPVTRDFIVLAPSGMPRKYYIKPVFTEGDNYLRTDFTLRGVEPAGSVVMQQAVRTAEGLDIYVVDAQFPLTLTPEFGIAADARFEGFENGRTALTFRSADDTATLRVAASTGAKKEWTIRVVNVPTVGGAEVPEQTRALTDLTSAKFRVAVQAEGFEYMGTELDNDTDTVRIYLRRGADAAFPVSLTAEMEASEGIGVIGFDSPQAFTCEEYGTAGEFYLVDTEERVTRHWTVALKEWLPGDADVLSFTYDYTASSVVNLTGATVSAAVLDPSVVEIYPQNRQICLKMTNVNEASNTMDWRLELSGVRLGLSDGAAAELPELVWVGNGSWEGKKSFNVTAPNGQIRTWSIVIRDYRNLQPSAACEVEKVEVRELLPLSAKLNGALPVEKKAADSTIYIRLAQDENSYPMSVKLDYELSPYARITSRNGGMDPIVFETYLDVKYDTVTAEDGIHAQTWKVKLVPPDKELSADVTDFKVTGFSSTGFSAEGVAIDPDRATITVSLARGSVMPVNLNYSMTLSPKATTDMALRGSLTLTSYVGANRFTVRAQDGTPKQWQVVLHYLPQLDNAGLDAWTDQNTPAGWATANNSIVKGTERSADGHPGSCARLFTQVVIGKVASGSLFLGWFDGSNPMVALQDPVRLTYQGISFGATKKIVGMKVDVAYHPGAGPGSDTGSFIFELVKAGNAPGEEYVYHGDVPAGGPHKDNNSVSVARNITYVGTAPGEQKGIEITQVKDDTWTEIYLPLEYSVSDFSDYTHLVLICASSSRGDSFIGANGSQMRVDNIRIVYEQ